MPKYNYNLFLQNSDSSDHVFCIHSCRPITVIHRIDINQNIALNRTLHTSRKDSYPQKEESFNMLIHAIESSDNETITELLDQFPYLPNMKTTSVTALQYASYLGNIEAISILLKHGARVSSCNNYTTHRESNFIEKIGIMENFKYYYHFQTALHYAKNQDTADILLRNGGKIDIDKKDCLSNTPLHLAILRNEEELALHLVKKGANTGISNSLNKTALHLAVKFGMSELTQALLESETALDIRDKNGFHASHYVKDHDIAELFLENDIDLQQIDPFFSIDEQAVKTLFCMRDKFYHNNGLPLIDFPKEIFDIIIEHLTTKELIEYVDNFYIKPICINLNITYKAENLDTTYDDMLDYQQDTMVEAEEVMP